jgi:hypothetical protein
MINFTKKGKQNLVSQTTIPQMNFGTVKKAYWELEI